MNALARVLSRAFPARIRIRSILKEVAHLAAAVAFVALLLATYGLDLSAGFF
jgi:hypothetical protein